ncbi:MAG: hypothetical protein ABI548_10885 [Polyangiaceae bacterium]
MPFDLVDRGLSGVVRGQLLICGVNGVPGLPFRGGVTRHGVVVPAFGGVLCVPRHSKSVPTVTSNDQVAHGTPPTSAVSGKTFHLEVGNYAEQEAAGAGAPFHPGARSSRGGTHADQHG